MITKAVLKDILQPINPKWKTSITKVQPNNLTTRGYSQEDLIGNISFTEMVYLLLKGELPSKNDSKMLQAVLVSFCDHGVTPPSTQAARIMASAGSPIPACLGGGILAFGENHAGAIENAMKIFQEGLNYNESSDFCTVDVASKIIDDFLDNDKKVPGFGHRYHDEDPRARKLIELAKDYDNYNYHLKLALCMEELLYARKGIKLNIDGANAAILSDLGFDWKIGSGFFIIGRLPGILAHVSEEKNEKPFQQYFI